MNNIIFELKNIVFQAKKENHSPEIIRIELKEYLQYFILDFIYNSEFKNLNFYGGSSIRILYELPRMSEDLDFEVEDSFDFDKFTNKLKEYFHSKLLLKDVEISSKQTNHNILSTTIKFQVLFDLGLSPNKTDKLKIKIDIRPRSKEYLQAMKIIPTIISKYGKSFIIRSYDLPTLMSTKIAAILQRKDRGFLKGDVSKGVDFRGRDFYDLLWYMQKAILPNEKALQADNIDLSIEEVFDAIALKISKMDLEGIKEDLQYLFPNSSYIDDWISVFRDTFERLHSTFYMPKKDLIL